MCAVLYCCCCCCCCCCTACPAPKVHVYCCYTGCPQGWTFFAFTCSCYKFMNVQLSWLGAQVRHEVGMHSLGTGLNQMLNHLPDSWKQLLHTFYQKVWLNETLPSIWKQSVIIPILKQGKPKSATDSYRPIALTSKKIILKRLLRYCEKKERHNPCYSSRF